MSTFTGIRTFNTKACPTCGVLYALEAEYDQRKFDNGGTWHCPNGHPVVYTTPEVKRLRDELERAQRTAINARADAEFQRDQRRAAERSARAQRGVATRLRNRITKGVCPFCRRHFPNVEAHMDTEHPKEADAS